MALLTILTLVYVAVLVAALAGGLIAIWVLLRRSGDALAETGEALTAARNATASLAGHLEPLKESCDRSAAHLSEAEERLTHVADRLQRTRRTEPALTP